MKVIATTSKISDALLMNQNTTHVIENDGKAIAIFGDYNNAKELAKHFEKCVNSHDILLEALIHARDFIIRCEDWKGSDPDMQLIESTINEATIK